jgi:hypothetical protein
VIEVLNAGEPRLAADAGLEVARLYAALAAALRAGRPPRALPANQPLTRPTSPPERK